MQTSQPQIIGYDYTQAVSDTQAVPKRLHHGCQAYLLVWQVLRRVLSHDVPYLLPSQAFSFQNGKGSLS